MQIGLLGMAILIGTGTIASLWWYSPMPAVVGAPFIASLLTGLAALVAPSARRPARRGPLPSRR